MKTRMIQRRAIPSSSLVRKGTACRDFIRLTVTLFAGLSALLFFPQSAASDDEGAVEASPLLEAVKLKGDRSPANHHSDPDESILHQERLANYLEQLEFRAIVTINGVTRFTLHNPHMRQIFALTEEKSRYGVGVVDFDPEGNALTLTHDGQNHTIYLEVSHLAVLVPEDENTRLKQIRDFRETWAPNDKEEFQRRIDKARQILAAALEVSPAMREIGDHLDELIEYDRETRRTIDSVEPDSPEHRLMQERNRIMREEFRLLSEIGMIEMQRNPILAGEDIEALHRMIFRIDPLPGEGRAADGLYGEYVSPYPAQTAP